MRAAFFMEPGVMQIREVPIPACPQGGLLVKVAYCGICGGDVRNLHSGLRDGITNQIMGHEISGEVIDVSTGVTRFHVGDRVALAPDISCGTCWYCKRGLVNLCNSHKMIGTHYPGGYAQFLAVPAEVLLRGFIERVPDGIDMRQAAFAETCAAVLACQKRVNVSQGDTIVIIGDGPVGCLHYEVAKARGASKVIILGRGKLALAARFAPDYLLNNREPMQATRKVLEITNGLGADIVILAVPNVAAQTQALEIVRRRGTVVIYGGAPKDRSVSQIDSNRLHYGEITLTGSFSYPTTGLSDALNALKDGIIHAERYITEVISLDEVVQGMEKMRAGQALKILIDPWLM